MKLITEPYLQQLANWPTKGQFILAQFNETSIVVYQAYNASIGHFAAANKFFGGEFKLGRMSWIKPNFLWMMYRSGWGTKEGQEVTLAITIRREAFDYILAQAVNSSFVPGVYPEHGSWRQQLVASSVRLQWDPDHDPSGQNQERRAIQLGLRGEVLKKFAREWIEEIEDISDFVATQRQYASANQYQSLVMPKEDVYPVSNQEVAKRLQLSQSPALAADS